MPGAHLCASGRTALLCLNINYVKPQGGQTILALKESVSKEKGHMLSDN